MDKKRLREGFEKLDRNEQIDLLYALLLKQIVPLYKSYGYEKAPKDVRAFWDYYLKIALVTQTFRYTNDLAIALDLNFALDLNQTLAKALDIDHAIDLNLALNLALNRARARARTLELDFALAISLAITLDRAIANTHIVTQASTRTLDFYSDSAIKLLEKLQKRKDIFQGIKIPHIFGVFEDFLLNKMDMDDADIFIWSIIKNASKSKELDSLIRFLEAARREQIGESKRARVILLGRGGAGKTSLVRRLFVDGGKLSDFDATPRIEIVQRSVDGIACDFWDFGGQVVMHSTHNFFLNEQAIYVVVCNARADEQPDRWLEKLRLRLNPSRRLKVLIVYTFVDKKKERKHFLKTKIRKNALERKYDSVFDLEFFALSNRNKDDAFYEFEDRLRELIDHQGSKKTITALHDVYKEGGSPLLCKEQIDKLVKSVQNKLQHNRKGEGIKEEWTRETVLKELYNYGYIFPMQPDIDRAIAEDECFVWQKHWLTYGVYALINDPRTHTKHGFLSLSDFKDILFGGKKRYIDQEGAIKAKQNALQNREVIQYDEEGQKILYQIVQRYGWAIPNRSRNDEIIFPHAVRLDEPESEIIRPYNLDNEKEQIIIFFETVPDNFFFRFVALAERHILKPELLWRNGVILFDLMDERIFMRVDIDENKMILRYLNSERGAYLLQFVLYYIMMLFEEEDAEVTAPRFFKKRIQDGQPILTDMQLMEKWRQKELKF